MCQQIATFMRSQSRKLCVDLIDLLGDADLAYQVAMDLGYWDKSLFDEDAFVAVRHEATRGVNLLLGHGGVDDMDAVPLELWDRADAKAVQLNTIYAECISELVDELNERVNRLDPTVLAGRRLGLATVHHVMNSVPRYSHARRRTGGARDPGLRCARPNAPPIRVVYATVGPADRRAVETRTSDHRRTEEAA